MTLFDAVSAVAEGAEARLGVTDLSPFNDVLSTMRRRIDDGLRGDLTFTYRDPERACDPTASFPWGRAIVVVAVPYLVSGDGSTAPVGGRNAPRWVDEHRTVARFADGDRYEPLRNTLAGIAEILVLDGWRTEIVYDDDRLVDRAVAIRAGVAWSGKSTMALAPGLGPWFLIGSVVTDAPLETTDPMIRDCGSCDACIPACPTSAIVAPGVLDARRCLAAIFQGRGAIERELRAAAGGRVYGCDACLVACPPGHPSLAVVDDASTIHPRSILAMSDREIDGTFAHWYIPGRRVRFVRRNALVAIGNVGDAGDVPLLLGYLGHHDALLRSHAAWALGVIGGAAALAGLRHRRDTERDTDVIDEIALVLR